MANGADYIVEVIRQLREEKSKQHLTCEDIQQLTENKGIYVSLKTIRRIMSPDCDDVNFRLSTLRNIAVAMGSDLTCAQAKEELARERMQLEKNYDFALQEIEHYKSLFSAYDDQIESMRLTIRGQDAHLVTLFDQSKINEKNVRRKDFFLHLYTVAFIFVLLLVIYLFASGFISISA